MAHVRDSSFDENVECEPMKRVPCNYESNM